MAETNGKKLTVPYVPFKTFLSVLDSFVSFLPDRIDATIWPNYSGGIRSQLLGAFKFFGLVNDDGTPTSDLRKMADDKSNRTTVFKDVMKRSYVDLMKLDLSKATPGSFDAEIRKYGQEGDTHRKAASFFLAAARWASVPLSPLLLKKGGLGVTRRKRGTSSKLAPAPVSAIAANGNSNAPSRQFVLPGDTVVTFSTNIDAMHMPSVDREIVFDILQQLEESEALSTDEETDADPADVA